MESLTRRLALKLMGWGTTLLGISKAPLSAAEEPADTSVTTNATAVDPVGRWEQTHDRVFLGGEFWANPMENWQIADGAAECLSKGGDRNVHLLTHQLTNADEGLAMFVRIKQLEAGKVEGGAGFRIGIRSDINEHRSNCFAKNGIKAGVVDGKLVLGPESKALPEGKSPTEFNLVLDGRPAGDKYHLSLTCDDPATNKMIARIEHKFPKEYLLGNVAIVNNFDANLKNAQGSRYRFSEWRVGGKAFTVTPEQKFGPLLWSMYTLSDSRGDEGFVLKITALTGPLGAKDNQQVELQIERDGQWKSVGEAKLDPDAWTATFRVPKWDETKAVKYQLLYREHLKDGQTQDSTWSGTIRSNPVDRPLRLGALTCQNDYAFPYEPVANNLQKLDPDMLYFSGDQIYENHGGYGIIRQPAEPAILNYLRKFYQFGWSFRDVIRDRPTVCLPDDHDVFQGNVWGEGGAPMRQGTTSSEGGYIEPARMVNVVHKTNVSHHPDYYDPTPCLQDISVYYGDLVYGNVSFAILGDRQWKSGPEKVDSGSGRADHVLDKDFDTSKLDKPGLVLLGERQEEFLKHWVQDWRGHSLKVLLSQTVFAGVATHHGGYNGYLKADLDCGSWPQTPRNRAVEILRPGKPLHINGDQHLTTLVQYGVDKQRDSCWSFCTPAIAVGYPRWWRPDEIEMAHENRPKHGLPNTGEFIDGLGNKVYVYAVGNPEVGNKRNRYELAHQKGSGFGLVTIDPQAKTYTICSYRFLVDATEDKPENQFPGWPVTIQQAENGGENLLG